MLSGYLDTWCTLSLSSMSWTQINCPSYLSLEVLALLSLEVLGGTWSILSQFTVNSRVPGELLIQLTPPTSLLVIHGQMGKKTEVADRFTEN